MLASFKAPVLKNVRSVEADRLEGDKIQPDHPLFGLIWINPARVSGTPCFYASRVPVQTLFDCFAAGESLDDFLEGFDGVTREQALGVLELASQGLMNELKNL
jgi:uncharacterized protein (DUF433 family)